MKLIQNNPEEILIKNNYKYVKGGVLDVACTEIGELPDISDSSKNTCLLNTFFDIKNLAKPLVPTVNQNIVIEKVESVPIQSIGVYTNDHHQEEEEEV